MDRAPVQSSHIAAIGFDDGTLEVEFSNGHVWQYPGVQPHEFAALSQAESKGQAFHALKARYQGVRVQ